MLRGTLGSHLGQSPDQSRADFENRSSFSRLCPVKF